MTEVTIPLSEYQQLLADKKRIEFMAVTERVTTTNKWVIQVLGIKGKNYSEYFRIPSKNYIPETWVSDRLTALRKVLDAAIQEELHLIQGVYDKDEETKKNDIELMEHLQRSQSNS
jgi:hypothetical protein